MDLGAGAIGGAEALEFLPTAHGMIAHASTIDRTVRSIGTRIVRVGQGNCSVRVLVGTAPPMFTRIGSRSLAVLVYFTTPSMFTSSR